MMASVSDLLVFSTCRKRYALHRGNQYPLLTRLKPNQVLGSIRHKFEEEFSSRTLNAQGISAEVWFETVWNLRIREGIELLRNLWPNRALPQPSTWPYFYVCKIGLERKYKNLTNVLVLENEKEVSRVEFFRRDTKNHDFESWRTPEIHLKEKKAELLLVSKTLGYFGFLDELSRDTTGAYHIKDYKLHLSEKRDPNSLSYRQMQLYAYLVYENYNSVPDATLVDVNNSKQEIYFNEIDILDIGTETRDVLKSLNSSLVWAASPSNSNCHSCPFKQVCDEYLDFQLKQIARGELLDGVSLKGEVLGVINYIGQPFVSLEIVVKNGYQIKEKMYISNILGWQSIEVGDTISIGELSRKSESVWRANRFSTLLDEEAIERPN